MSSKRRRHVAAISMAAAKTVGALQQCLSNGVMVAAAHIINNRRVA
jgi:hypothetical protein